MISRLAMSSIDGPLFPKQERAPGMTTPALRSARRALPILALTAALLAIVPAGASASTLLHSWQAELSTGDSIVPAANGTAVGSFSYDLGHNSDHAFKLNVGTSNQAVTLAPIPDFYPGGSFTVQAWVKTSITTGPLMVVMGMDECAGAADLAIDNLGANRPRCRDTVQPGSNSLSTWQLGVKDGRAYAFVRDSNAGGLAAESFGQRLVASQFAPLTADDQWHQLVLIMDREAGRVALYQDGVVMGEQIITAGVSGTFQDVDTVPGPAPEADKVVIGAQLDQTQTPFNEFGGLIDDVQFLSGADYPDKTPPDVKGQILGDTTDGWYTSDFVAVRWTIRDESIVRSTSNCADTEITEDTPGVTVTCSASSAGGTTSTSVFVKRDATPPVLTCDQPSDQRYAVGDKATMSASVTDATSGPKVTSVSKAIDSAEKGQHSITLSAEDTVNNLGSINCLYLVIKPVIRKVALTTVAKVASPKACIRTRKLALRLKKLSGAAVVTAQIAISGRIVKTITGIGLQQPILLTKLPARGSYSVTVTLTDANGDKRVAARRYHSCTKAKKKK